MHQACGKQMYAIWPRNYMHSSVHFISVISWGGPSNSSNLFTNIYLSSTRGVWVQLTDISIQYELTLNPAWISNRMTAHCCEWSHSIVMLSYFTPTSNEFSILSMITMCVVIYYTVEKQFLNFNDSTIKVWEWISNFILHIIMFVIIYLCLDFG